MFLRDSKQFKIFQFCFFFASFLNEKMFFYIFMRDFFLICDYIVRSIEMSTCTHEKVFLVCLKQSTSKKKKKFSQKPTLHQIAHSRLSQFVTKTHFSKICKFHEKTCKGCLHVIWNCFTSMKSKKNWWVERGRKMSNLTKN